MSDPNIQNFQAPPPTPIAPAAETMTTPQTLINIFFEPGRTFEALRARPRFLVATIILILLTVIVTLILFQKVDFSAFMLEKMQSSGRPMPPPEQMGTAMFVGKIIGEIFPPVIVLCIIFIGAALYLLGVMMMGKKISYKEALSVWVYSGLPPTVIASIMSIIILFIKPEVADFSKPNGGLLVTNPAALMGPDSSQMLAAALSSFDILKFYGLALAAIGLHKIARISKGAAWTIVIMVWFIGLILSVIGSFFR